MTPRIETITPKNLVGMRVKTSLADDHTFKLWSGFMPRRKEIENTIGTVLYSVQVYDQPLDFSTFTPATVFEKWATVEVPNFDNIPDGMETLTLAGGKYAVFIHKGTPQDFPKTAQFIFGEWLPNSEYHLDERAHFEILGEKYKRNDPSSEEEVWIPINK